MFELWSDINDDIAALVVVVCVDDNDGKDELSIELETLLIVVVADSVRGEDVPSMVIDVFSLVKIPFLVVEINWVVDSSDSMEEVWILCELNGVVNTEVSNEIDSLFDNVAVAMDNSSICVVDNGV